MALLERLIIRIDADLGGLTKLSEAERRVVSMGRSVQGLGRSLSMGLTLPIVGAGFAALRSSIQFEDAMAGVAKTVDLSVEAIAALGEEFKELSEEIPVAATELANIGEAAGQLGIATTNILSFTRVMADLGVATNLTSQEAATDLARLANITQMPQDSFDRLGSTIVALGNNLATTEREIVQMGLRLAGAGNQVGLTEAQILSLAAALSSVGIEAEAGGTALSKVIGEMANAVGEGGDKLDRFAQIAGTTAEEFAKSFEDDAADAIVTFIEGIGRLSDEGVNVFQVLESVEFGNVRVRAALLNAAGAGDKMRESLDLGNKAWRENTALTIEAEKFYATIGNQLKVAWNEVKNMTAELGDNLAPATIAVVDASKPLLGFVRDAIKGFGELPKHIQITALGVAALTATLGPLLYGLGALLALLPAIKIGFGLLSAPILLGAAAFAVWMVAGAALVANWKIIEYETGRLKRALLGLFGVEVKDAIDGVTASQEAFTRAIQGTAKVEILSQRAEAIAREAEANRKLADARRVLNSIPPVGDAYLDAADNAVQLREEAAQASEEVARLNALLDELETTPGPTSPLAPPPPLDADKRAALAKQLQDELVAMTKTAVDDMQLEYDRLEAHILAVDGVISEEWQAVLDGMREKIENVGLGEAFAEQIEALGASVDALGDSLTSTGASSMLDSLGSLRGEILATTGGAEEFKHELAQIEAIIRRLQGKKVEVEFDSSGDFFGGLADQAKGILDPQAIISTALGTLLSGGVSMIVSSVMSGIGGALGFGGSSEAVLAAREAQLANTEAVKKNMAAANRLADNLNALANETVGLPFDVFAKALTEGRRRQREEQRAQDPRSISNIQFDEDVFAEFGLTMAEVNAIVKATGLDFQNFSRDSGALLVWLENMNTFNRDFGLLQQQFALFDIEDPAEQFASVMDLLASQVSEDFAAVLEGLTPENFDAWLEEMFAGGFADFDMSLLGDLDFDQFMTAIGFAESALDGLASEVERATAALRNAPAGFKVTAARFRASDPEVLDNSTSPPDDSTPPRDDRFDEPPEIFDEMIARPPIIVEGDIVLQGVQDPDDFLDKFEDKIQWRGRTGGSIIKTRTRRA